MNPRYSPATRRTYNPNRKEPIMKKRLAAILLLPLGAAAKN
jgi:hypothetical protein